MFDPRINNYMVDYCEPSIRNRDEYSDDDELRDEENRYEKKEK